MAASPTTSNHQSRDGSPYNFSAIFNYFPSRFLKRTGRVLDGDHDVDNSQQPARPVARFPGPFSFFTSAYVFGLFIMFFVLHRIQHIVVPVQRPLRSYAPHRSHRRLSYLHRFLPIDPQAKHALVRVALHLPTLYLLSQKLLLWVLLVLQTSGIQIGCCNSLVEWAEKKEMAEVCWSTFVAICAAFCVEAFVRALDGQSMHDAAFGMGAGQNPNTSPFNLVGYAFLLHIYASPSSHSYHPSEKTMPTRPDKHIVLTIAIPLIQLTILHILSTSRRFSTHRLLPTALASFLSLTHFHLTLLSHSVSKVNIRAGHPQNYPLLNYVPNVFETLLILSILLTHFLNLLTRLVIFASGSSDTNANINAYTRTRTHHRSSHHPRRPRSTTTSLLTPLTYLHTLLSSLPYEEDFGVVLLRAGTQSLEAAAGRGWRNEVASVYAGWQFFGGGFEDEDEGKREKEKFGKESVEYGSMRIGRADVGGMVNANVLATKTNRTTKRTLNGLRNEIRTVSSSALPLTPNPTFDGTAVDFWGIQRNFVRAVSYMFGFGFGSGVQLRALGRFACAGAGVGWRIVKAFGFWKGEAGGRDNLEGEDEEGEEDGEEMYRRFLSGESLSSGDEEDEEYCGGSDEEGDEEGSAEEFEEVDGEDEDSGTKVKNEVMVLLGDILFPSSIGTRDEDHDHVGARDLVLSRLLQSPSTSAPPPNPNCNPGSSTSASADGDAYSTGMGPMTRRRWGALSDSTATSLSGVDHKDDGGGWFDGRRHGGRSESGSRTEGREGYLGEAVRACVVCLAEERVIICWPCRCLAMCDGCREAMASQGVPSKHQCPCCRQSVEGFSRIYVP